MHNGRPDEPSSQPPPTSSRCLQAPGIFCTMLSNKVLCQHSQIFTMGSVKKPLDGFQTGAQPFNHFKTANGPMFRPIICVPPSLIAASMFKISSQIGQQSFLCNLSPTFSLFLCNSGLPPIQKLLRVLGSQLAFVQSLFQRRPESLGCHGDEWLQLQARARALQYQALEQEVASQRRIQVCSATRLLRAI